MALWAKCAYAETGQRYECRYEERASTHNDICMQVCARKHCGIQRVMDAAALPRPPPRHWVSRSDVALNKFVAALFRQRALSRSALVSALYLSMRWMVAVLQRRAAPRRFSMQTHDSFLCCQLVCDTTAAAMCLYVDDAKLLQRNYVHVRVLLTSFGYCIRFHFHFQVEKLQQQKHTLKGKRKLTRIYGFFVVILLFSFWLCTAECRLQNAIRPKCAAKRWSNIDALLCVVAGAAEAPSNEIAWK